MQRTRRSRSRNRNANQSLANRVNQLTQMVEQLAVGRRTRSRSRSRGTRPQMTSAPAATSRVVQRGTPGQRQRRRSPAPGTMDMRSAGIFRFTNREMFCSITHKAANTQSGAAILVNTQNTETFLYKLGSLFGRYRWLSLDFYYESQVASSSDGMVAYGLDWSCKAITFAAKATTLAVATSLNPSISHPVWDSSHRLPRAPQSRLNARTWYDSDSTTAEISSVCAFYYFLNTPVVTNGTDVDKNYGIVWIEYTIEFEGPHL